MSRAWRIASTWRWTANSAAWTSTAAAATWRAKHALISLGATLRELGLLEQTETVTHYVSAIGRQQQDLHVQEAALSAGTLRMKQERWPEAEAPLHDASTVQRQRQDPLAQVETFYKFAMIAHAHGQSEEELVEILWPAWELAQEHGYGHWLVNMAWLWAMQRLNKAPRAAITTPPLRSLPGSTRTRRAIGRAWIPWRNM